MKDRRFVEHRDDVVQLFERMKNTVPQRVLPDLVLVFLPGRTKDVELIRERIKEVAETTYGVVTACFDFNGLHEKNQMFQIY